MMQIYFPKSQILFLMIHCLVLLLLDKKTNERLLKSKLSLFCHIIVLEEEMKSPFAWWKKHECQFSNVGFDLV